MRPSGTTLLIDAVAEIALKFDERHTLPVDTGDAAKLALHLAVFGPDQEMPRSRRLAEKLATAISLAERGDPEPLRLSQSQRDDLCAALNAMIDERAGNLSDGLLVLREYCLSTLDD